MYNHRMQSNKAFKYCKYCKLSDHFIDSCPEILCKKCNERGHPHWKCTKKRNIGHAFDDRDSNSEGSRGGGGFNRVGSKNTSSRPSLYMEVVEEEVKPKMKKSESQNVFQALDDEDELFDTNSIFHFLQYIGKAWVDL